MVLHIFLFKQLKCRKTLDLHHIRGQNIVTHLVIYDTSKAVHLISVQLYVGNGVMELECIWIRQILNESEQAKIKYVLRERETATCTNIGKMTHIDFLFERLIVSFSLKIHFISAFSLSNHLAKHQLQNECYCDIYQNIL